MNLFLDSILIIDRSAQQEVEWREALALYFVDMSVSLQLSLVDVCDESM